MILLVPLLVLAGCLGTTEDPGPAHDSDAQAPLPPPGHGINESVLSTDDYGILERQTATVEASIGGVQLYVELFLPEGDGPWPTILENSPYYATRANGNTEDLGVDDGTTGLVERYVPKGYAVVLAHVRGTGNSEGCMDMMGPLEQQDAHDVVEWIAQQDWSDGKVGMHGVSYVGTTPHMAAIHAPEHLETIVTIAGVTNQWRNVYNNGVPYQGRHYPLTYEAISGTPPPTHVTEGPAWALAAASGACVPQEQAAAMAPGTYEKGVYTEYWDERNLTKGAQDVRASMLYSQGFIDRAVNPSEAIHWFNEVNTEKKGFFHQAGHTYPPREDYFTFELAWFDHYLKGKDTGVLESATVEVITNRDTIRVDETWPPQNTTGKRYFLGAGTLSEENPDEGSETYLADQWRSLVLAGDGPVDQWPTNRLEYVSEPLQEELFMAGAATFHLQASVDAQNTYFLSDLYLVRDGQWEWLAAGWMNAHLRDGFDRSAPLDPGMRHAFTFAFEPRDWVFEQGDQIGLRIVGNDNRVGPIDAAEAFQTENTVYYGEEGSWIEIPLVDDPQEHERPEGV